MIGPRWVVDAFLRELDGVRLNEPDTAPHVVERRAKLAAMVLEEVPNDDAECLALRALAGAMIDLYDSWSPATIERYLSARTLHRDVLRAAYDAG